ncbi:MAG: DUF4178 domain-containing protein [Flavobacteriia bacterium]|nr:DUF4178 domain-containing protein [Flavobacteriia bacterium]OJX37029.1 MAG: hypothetical protein BGO87_14735 [Flavobacteriia bacterium 40-80]
MGIVCTSCQYVFNTTQIQSHFNVFVCPECQELHSFEKEEIIFVGKFKQAEIENPLGIDIGDVFLYNSSKYTITNISKKESMQDSWWEYGGMNAKNEWYFFSFSDNFKKGVFGLKEFKLPQQFDLNAAKQQGVRKYRKYFRYDYMYSAKTTFASGIFQYDIREKVTYYPFNCDVENDSSFLSIESAGKELFGYYGNALTMHDFYNRFENKKDKNKSSYRNYYFNFFNMCVLVLMFFGLIFLGFHYKGLFFDKEVLYESTEVKENSLFVSNYRLKQKIDLSWIKSSELTIDGSVESRTHPVVYFSLISLSKNRMVYSQRVGLNYNSINYASALNILINNLEPGEYELRISANTPKQIIIPTDYLEFDVMTDLRFTVGHIIRYTPFVVALIVVIVLFYLMYLRLDRNYKMNKKSTSIDILLMDRYMYIVLFIFAAFLYTSAEVYNNNYRGANIETLEDASYIGRSNHYVYKSESYSNHK